MFTPRQLAVLAYGSPSGFTLWHYHAPREPLSEVTSPRYFASATGYLTGGDHVLVSAQDGGASLYVHERDGHLLVAQMTIAAMPQVKHAPATADKITLVPAPTFNPAPLLRDHIA